MFDDFLKSCFPDLYEHFEFVNKQIEDEKRKQCLSCKHCYTSDCKNCNLQCCKNCRSEIILCDLHKECKLQCRFYKKQKQMEVA